MKESNSSSIDKTTLKYYFAIAIISILLFVPFLGNVHLFDWDEINFAESAREMIATQDYLNVRINFQMFWEKPPLFIWMQVISMKIFGINEFAARFPNAVIGIITLLILFRIGKKYFDNKFGLYWVLAYIGSILPHFYFKSGIIDPCFNLFIFLGIFNFIEFLSVDKKRKLKIILSASFIGLATLTKGPVAILVFSISIFIYFIIKKFRIKITISEILLFIVFLTLTGGFWFILQIISGNYTIIEDFVVYQIRLFETKDAGHGGFLGYHFVILFFGVFPASIFALKSFNLKKEENIKHKTFKQIMMILFWVVLILFTIVKTKIVHYSSLCYFPLTFLGAYAIYKTQKEEFPKSKIISGILIGIAFIFGILPGIMQYVGLHTKKIIESGLIKDDFANANLQATPHWSGFEFLIGLFLLIGIIFVLIFFKNKYQHKIISIFVITTIYINLTMSVIVPKIEAYSQNSAIEFYIKKQNEDAYIQTYGFKSYAHLFYTKKQQKNSCSNEKETQLLIGTIDKPTYFVCKIIHEKEFAEKYPKFKKLYDKNGFSFFERKP